MLRRMVALAFAGLVLAFAFAVRAERDESEPDRPGPERPADAIGGPPAENPYEVFEEGDVSLLCVEELEAVCADLASMDIEVRTEAAWSTVARLRDGGRLGSDAWLTIRPFEHLAGQFPPGATSRALASRTEVLARSPIVLAGPAPAIEAMRSDCPDAVTRFACATAGDRAATTALHDPRSSAVGTLALTTLAHELGAGAPLWALDDPATAAHVEAVVSAARRTPSPLLDAERIGGRTIALTVEAELVARLAQGEYDDRERVAEGFGVDYPIDVRPVEVVAVAGPDFRRLGDLDRVLRSRGTGFAFERAGYLPVDEPSYLLDLAVFTARPPVRTDLAWTAPLVEDVREAAG